MFLFLSSFIYSQEKNSAKNISGKILSNHNDSDGIYIVNKSTEKATVSNPRGFFEINASVGDTLLFSAVQYKGMKLAITQENFDKEMLLVKLEPLMHYLDEVKIMQFKNINAVSLGIISANTKHYSPAERKLYTAQGGEKNQYGLNTRISVDGILNSLSGRTAMLEKEVEVEKKETLLQKIENLFENNYFIDGLKIPKEYVEGFKYFLVEDLDFSSFLNAKNKTMTKFVMGDLAVKYLENLKIK
jgi:hypothetical protein